MAEKLIQGACLDENTEYAKVVGRAEEIRDLLNMTYEDMLPKE